MKISKLIKSKLVEYCQESFRSKLSNIDDELKALHDALTNETKSSAGDKYETSIEMIQRSKNKLLQQKSVLLNNKKLLTAVQRTEKPKSVCSGSLVKTNMAIYLIGPSIGKIELEEGIVFSVSPSSPICQAMLGKTIGDMISFNGNTFKILDLV